MTKIEGLTEEELRTAAKEMDTQKLKLFYGLFFAIAEESKDDPRVKLVIKQMEIIDKELKSRDQNVTVKLDTLNLIAKKD